MIKTLGTPIEFHANHYNYLLSNQSKYDQTISGIRNRINVIRMRGYTFLAEYLKDFMPPIIREDVDANLRAQFLKDLNNVTGHLINGSEYVLDKFNKEFHNETNQKKPLCVFIDEFIMELAKQEHSVQGLQRAIDLSEGEVDLIQKAQHEILFLRKHFNNDYKRFLEYLETRNVFVFFNAAQAIKSMLHNLPRYPYDYILGWSTGGTDRQNGLTVNYCFFPDNQPSQISFWHEILHWRRREYGIDYSTMPWGLEVSLRGQLHELINQMFTVDYATEMDFPDEEVRREKNAIARNLDGLEQTLKIEPRFFPASSILDYVRDFYVDR